MAFKTFRDAARLLSPRWLKHGTAEKILYSLALHFDAIVDWMAQAVRRRFPLLDSDDSLGRIGRDRRIARGRAETSATYAVRLLRWLDDHRHRGGPYALLAQLHAHYAAAPFLITLEYPSGLKFAMATDGSVTWDFSGTWPPGTPGWSQWLLTYQWPDDLPPPTTWGSGDTWGDGILWGSGLSPDDVADLRLIPQEWNAAHCRGKLWLVDPLAHVLHIDIPS